MQTGGKDGQQGEGSEYGCLHLSIWSLTVGGQVAGLVFGRQQGVRQMSGHAFGRQQVLPSPLPSVLLLAGQLHRMNSGRHFFEGIFLHWNTGLSSVPLNKYGFLLCGIWNWVTIFFPKQDTRMKRVTSPTHCPVAVAILNVLFNDLHGLPLLNIRWLNRSFIKSLNCIWYVPINITSGNIPGGSFLYTVIVTGKLWTGFWSTLLGRANRQDFPFLNTWVSPLMQAQPSLDASSCILIGGKLRICFTTFLLQMTP